MIVTARLDALAVVVDEVVTNVDRAQTAGLLHRPGNEAHEARLGLRRLGRQREQFVREHLLGDFGE